jgi:two-component system chemotaxis response regulator CheB
MEALSLGASDFIMKPTGSASEDVHAVKDQLTDMLLAYGTQYRARRGKSIPKASLEHLTRSGAGDPEPSPTVLPSSPLARSTAMEVSRPPRPAVHAKVAERPTPLRKPAATEIIAIGISTGGPNALREVFAKLDPDLSQPWSWSSTCPGVHAEFAKSLDRLCPLDVKEAEEGDLIKSAASSSPPETST